SASAPTFTFTHGDGWTRGGEPLRVDNRADWLATVAKAPYASRVLDSVKAEVHGDVVITYGRYVGRFKDAAPGRRQVTVWYGRVNARRDGRGQYLSHRRVNGPVYEKECLGESDAPAGGRANKTPRVTERSRLTVARSGSWMVGL